MKYIDLHVHSNASDGTYTPKELVSLAKKSNIAAFALTDHDTVDGVETAIIEGKKQNVEVIPAIELSAKYNGKEIHILGYGIDYKSEKLQRTLDEFEHIRNKRNEKIIERLQQQGFSITFEKIRELFPIGVITRMHLAKYLVENSYVSSTEEAFDKYLGDRGCCFVPKEEISVKEAIQCILRNKGCPVLAHPMRYRLTENELDNLVEECTTFGLIGIEAIYSTNTWYDEQRTRQLANKYNLLITGGSDFHGENKPHIKLGIGRGNLKIPYSILSNLKKY